MTTKDAAAVSKTIVKIRETKAKVSPKEGVEWGVVVTGSIEEGVATIKLVLVGEELADGATLDFNGQSTKEEGSKDDYAAKITSNYKGNLTRTQGKETDKLTDILSIKKVEQEGVMNKVNLTLKDFILGNQYLGDVVVENIPVVGELLVKSEEDVTVKLVETSSKFVFEDGKEWNIVVSGTVKAGTVTLKLDVTASDLPQGLILDFSGKTTTIEEIKREASISDLKFSGDFVIIRQPNFKLDGENLMVVALVGISQQDIASMSFTAKMTDRATIVEPADNKLDLSSGKAVIKVESIDKKTTKEYSVELKVDELFYDMENWVVEYNSDGPVYAPGPDGVWGSSNQGASMATGGALGVSKELSDVHSGKGAVKIQTYKSSFMLGDMIPKVTPGSLFMGYFKLNILKPLASTNFGIPFDKKPLSVSGFYKYTSGKVFWRVPEGGKKSEPVEEPNTKDKCAINAILYEVASEDAPYVTGDKTYEDSRIVAKGMFSSEDTNGYEAFNVNVEFINGNTFDKNKKYRFAIIASSSAEGDTYSGAPGSTLYLDEIKVSYMPN